MGFTAIKESLKDCSINRERVLTYISTHGSITPLMAFAEWSETRLATYILDLRNEGWGITSYARVSDAGKRFTEYEFTTRQREIVESHGLDAYPVYLGAGRAPEHSRFMHRKAA